MCGIVAFVAPARDFDPALLGPMNRTQGTRGPDGAGSAVLAGGAVGLAHTRLAIIDLTDAGAQPMATEDGQHWLTFNGEIYNFRELRRELEGLGERLRSTSDSEVLLLALRRWGREALTCVEGMFAFVYADLARGRVLAARDRLGIKPLFVSEHAGRAVFASTLAPLRMAPWFDGAVDPVARFEMLISKYVTAPRSIFRQVRKIEPGCGLELGLDGDREEFRYWAPAPRPAPERSEDQWREALAGALDRAVTRQLVADVPLGVFLSGGLDSALVAALAARRAGALDTFTVGYAEDAYDESARARAIAAHLGTRHHELLVTPRDAMDAVPAVLAAFDEPFGDASAIPTWLVARFAAGTVKAVLTGDGGDEQFFGYTRYHLLARALPFIRLLPAWARRLAARLPLGAPRPRLGHALAAFAAFPDEAGLYAHFVLENFARQAELAGAGPTATLEATGHAVLGRRAHALAGGVPGGMMLADLMHYLPDDCLVKTDRATMANSLEARVPLLDEAVLETSLAMPLGLKWRGNRGKYLLRRVLEDLLPAALTRGPKQGFGVPLDTWLFGGMADLSTELLSPGALRDAGLDPDGVARIAAAHKAGRADHQYFLWPVCAYVHWHRTTRDPLRPGFLSEDRP